jgi:hypothetical protein
MALVKLTFDGAINTAKNDAIFNYYLVNKVNGIFYDLGGKIYPSVANGKITFADGFVSIYGRRVYVEKDTSITVTLDSSAYGTVVIKVDTSANTVTLVLKEATNVYPSLTQTNLLEEEGVFELPICYYRKTASSLSIDTSQLVYISTNKDELQAAKSEIVRTIDSKQYGIASTTISHSSYSKGVQKFDLNSLKSKDVLIISFYLCNNIVTLNSKMLGGRTGISVNYKFLGQDYTAIVEYENGTLIITAGDISHEVFAVFVSY